MSHMAKLRSEHSPVIPFHCDHLRCSPPELCSGIVISSRKAALKGRLFPVRERFLYRQGHLCLFFTVREGCTHFSLAFTSRSGATPLLGRRLSAGRTFASPFLEFPESMVVLEAACPLWGGHLRVLDDEASLWQRCLSVLSSCTMPSITSTVTSFWYSGDTK